MLKFKPFLCRLIEEDVTHSSRTRWSAVMFFLLLKDYVIV